MTISKPLGIRPQRVQDGVVAAATFSAALAAVLVGSLGPNVELAALSAVVLMGGVALLWRSGEPPVLLFVFLFQWLQASTGIYQATYAGQTIDVFFEGTDKAGVATFLSLIALTAMAIGMRAGMGAVRRDLQQYSRTVSTLRPTRTWFFLYLTFWLIGAGAELAISLASGLAQLLYGVQSFRWAFFFMLAVVHFNRGPRAGLWFPGAFAFELAMGIGGYFSDFRTVFFMTFLAMVTSGVRMTPARILGAIGVAGAALAMAIVWQAIKPEYRQFVSGGERAQIVTVGYPEQVAKLTELVGDLDGEKLSTASHEFFSRLSYVEFFGSTLEHVPSVVPHEGGNLLLDAFIRPFTPRLFFPDKTEINDSERTRYYTGLGVSGVEEGTSISLGWVAEMYIDFGTWGMMLAAFGIGLFYGLIHRMFTCWTWSRGFLGYATATALLIAVAPLESSITKLVGGVVASVIVALIIVRFVIPVTCPWIIRPRA